MEIKYIGFIKAVLKGHPIRRWYVETSDGHIYLNKVQWNMFQQYIDETEERRKIQERQHEHLLARFNETDRERERAIDGWYEDSTQLKKLQDDYAHQESCVRTLTADGANLRRQLSNARQRTSELEIDISNMGGLNRTLGFLKQITPQEQKYVAAYLASVLPKKREGPIKTNENPHDHHKRPRDFDKLRERLNIPYVREIIWHMQPCKKTRVVGLETENNSYYVNVVYTDGNSFGARIRLGTTAETQQQAEFVKSCIEQLIDKS